MLLRRYHDVPKKNTGKPVKEKKVRPSDESAPKAEEVTKRHIPLDPSKITADDVKAMNYLRLKALAKDLSVEVIGKDREMLRSEILEVMAKNEI